ncbi:MAG TPA: RDD family protein [Desulfatiglandales bacterium]|nr:RDD family protein [Desulfatiglandales bacterium]
MKIVCPTCNKDYSIAEDKIPHGKKSFATCKKCGGRISIDPGAEKEPSSQAQKESLSESPLSSTAEIPSSPETESKEFEFIPEYTEFKGYGGFWKRVAAAIIDGFILIFIMLIIGSLAPGIGSGMLGDAGSPGTLLGIIIGWLYYAMMESSSKQGTLGKMALGIKVTDLSGNKITFGRATGRHFSKYISAIILFIGYLMVAFTAKKQGLHDMIAGCLVVNSR